MKEVLIYKLKSKKENSHFTIRTSHNSGITLVALIITIIVLLILAVVAIRVVQGDGIILKSKEAAYKYTNEQGIENSILQGYIADIDQYLDNITGGNNTIGGSTEEDLDPRFNKVLSETDNIEIQDDYGNKIVVPAGFKILVDESTNNAKTVDKGIVIEDVSAGTATIGNQFVWVPVGNIKTSKEDTTGTNIELKRYVFTNTGAIDETLTKIEPTDQLKETLNSDEYFTEPIEVEEFRTSVATNGGYYIGRYEASNNSGTVVCKYNEKVYDMIGVGGAFNACQSMYSEKPYKSRLQNSYSWDTTILFIQECSKDSAGNKNATNYSNNNNSTAFRNTGLNKDEYCNINDMSGNAQEWTTERCSDEDWDRVGRGGSCSWQKWNNTKYRFTDESRDNAMSLRGFRPILYLYS